MAKANHARHASTETRQAVDRCTVTPPWNYGIKGGENIGVSVQGVRSGVEGGLLR